MSKSMLEKYVNIDSEYRAKPVTINNWELVMRSIDEELVFLFDIKLKKSRQSIPKGSKIVAADPGCGCLARTKEGTYILFKLSECESELLMGKPELIPIKERVLEILNRVRLSLAIK